MAVSEEELRFIISAVDNFSVTLEKFQTKLKQQDAGVKSLFPTFSAFGKGISSLTSAITGVIKPAMIVSATIAGWAYSFEKVAGAVLTTGERWQRFRISLIQSLGSAEAAEEGLKMVQRAAENMSETEETVIAAFVRMAPIMQMNEKRLQGLSGAAGSFGMSMELMAEQMHRFIVGGIGAADLLRERGAFVVLQRQAQQLGIQWEKMSRQQRELLATKFIEEYAAAGRMALYTWSGSWAGIIDYVDKFKKMVADAGFYDKMVGLTNVIYEELKKVFQTDSVKELAKMVSTFLWDTVKIVGYTCAFIKDAVVLIKNYIYAYLITPVKIAMDALLLSISSAIAGVLTVANKVVQHLPGVSKEFKNSLAGITQEWQGKMKTAAGMLKEETVNQMDLLRGGLQRGMGAMYDFYDITSQVPGKIKEASVFMAQQADIIKKNREETEKLLRAHDKIYDREMKKLDELKAKKQITDEEYEAEHRRLLAEHYKREEDARDKDVKSLKEHQREMQEAWEKYYKVVEDLRTPKEKLEQEYNEKMMAIDRAEEVAKEELEKEREKAEKSGKFNEKEFNEKLIQLQNEFNEQRIRLIEKYDKEKAALSEREYQDEYGDFLRLHDQLLDEQTRYEEEYKKNLAILEAAQKSSDETIAKQATEDLVKLNALREQKMQEFYEKQLADIEAIHEDLKSEEERQLDEQAKELKRRIDTLQEALKEPTKYQGLNIEQTKADLDALNKQYILATSKGMKIWNKYAESIDIVFTAIGKTFAKMTMQLLRGKEISGEKLLKFLVKELRAQAIAKGQELIIDGVKTVLIGLAQMAITKGAVGEDAVAIGGEEIATGTAMAGGGVLLGNLAGLKGGKGGKGGGGGGGAGGYTGPTEEDKGHPHRSAHYVFKAGEGIVLNERELTKRILRHTRKAFRSNVTVEVV